MSEPRVNEFNPALYERAVSGDLFIYTVLSQALVLAATGGGHPTVINPAGSGKNFVPLALRIGFISGTVTIGSVLLAETLNVGSAAATGAAIPTATLVSPKNAYRQGANAKGSVMQWSPTTNTFTAAPAVLEATGLNLGAAAPTGSGSYEVRFDGSRIFAPGTALSLVYSVTTSTALFCITLIGAEVAIPQ